MPAVARLLTIVTVGTFSGGRRGQPEPDAGAWPGAALARGRTVARAADPVPAGGRTGFAGAAFPLGALLSRWTRRRRARHYGARISPVRAMAGPATPGRRQACPRAGLPGRGTAPAAGHRSRAPAAGRPAVPAPHMAPSPAARRRDSRTRPAPVRPAAVRAGTGQRWSRPGRSWSRVPTDQGPGRVPGPYGDGFAGQGPAVFPAPGPVGFVPGPGDPAAPGFAGPDRLRRRIAWLPAARPVSRPDGARAGISRRPVPGRAPAGRLVRPRPAARAARPGAARLPRGGHGARRPAGRWPVRPPGQFTAGQAFHGAAPAAQFAPGWAGAGAPGPGGQGAGGGSFPAGHGGQGGPLPRRTLAR